MGERAHDRIGREAAERAERAELHGMAEVFQKREVGGAILVRDDPVDDLDAAGRADPAGRALAAGFDRAELHREAGLPRHVDRVVEHDDAAVPDQAVGLCERFVVERQAELRAREIGAERPADLDRADGTAAPRSAADLVDELAEGDAERRFKEPGVLDVAGELDRHRAARLAHAEVAVEGAALLQDQRHGGKREHVVDDGRLAEQPLVRRERRLGADDAALSLQAVEEGRLLAADIGAGADPDLQVELMRRAGNAAAEHARPAGGHDRLVERSDRVGIFGADVDEALRRADGDAGDRHPLDQHEGIAFHDHAVGEGAAVALVSIADDVFPVGERVGNGLPLDPGREAGAAAAAQSRLGDLLDDCRGSHRQRPLQAGIAAMSAVIVERTRIDDAAAGEGEPRLPLEERDRLGDAEVQGMLVPGGDCRIEHAPRIGHGHRAIGDAARRGLDLDHRLQPIEAARAVADDLDRHASLGGGLPERLGDRVAAERDGAGVAGNEQAEASWLDLGQQVVELPLVQTADHAAVEHRRRRGRTETEAIDRLEADRAIGRGVAERDPGLGLGVGGERVATGRLARLGAAELQDVPGRRSPPEVVVEGDDAVHFRAREVQDLGDEPDCLAVDVAELVLQRVQDRQERTRHRSPGSDDAARRLDVPWRIPAQPLVSDPGRSSRREIGHMSPERAGNAMRASCGCGRDNDRKARPARRAAGCGEPQAGGYEGPPVEQDSRGATSVRFHATTMKSLLVSARCAASVAKWRAPPAWLPSAS